MGHESSLLESSNSDTLLMSLSKVDGSVSSEIECAGGIWREMEDDGGMGGQGEEGHDGKGAGLTTLVSVLLHG
jgi:hypothetical protein